MTPCIRRRAAAICVIVAPLCYLIFEVLSPSGISSTSAAADMRAAAAAPAAWTVAAVANEAFFFLLLPGVVAVMGFLRGRGRTLGLIGGVLTCCGLLVSGFGLAESMLSLVAASLPAEAAAGLVDAFDSQPVAVVFDVLILLMQIGLLLALIGAVRGGLVRWWLPVLYVVGAFCQGAGGRLLLPPLSVVASLPFLGVFVLLGVALLRSPASQPVVGAPGERAAAVLV